MIVGRLRNDVAFLFDLHPDWLDSAGLWLVAAVVEDLVEFLGHVLSGAAHWPWIGVVGIAAALSDFLGVGFAAVSQWHAEKFLFRREADWGLGDDTRGGAVLDVGADHGSRAADGDNDWCRVILNHRSVVCWLRLVRDLGSWGWWSWAVLLLGGVNWRLGARRSWTGLRWTRSWRDEVVVVVRWRLIVAREVLIARLLHDVSFGGENLGGRSGSGNVVVQIICCASSLSKTATDFRCIAAARLKTRQKTHFNE